MGCASSKQKRCRHCSAQLSPTHRSFSPAHRSYSLHGRPTKRDEAYHLVALTSSTLGSLKLDRYHHEECLNGDVANDGKEFAAEINEAKTWSTMIEEKIPKMVPRTPITTPPGEPEIINAWELMEGLEEVSPFRSPIHVRSFSFDVVKNPTLTTHDNVERPKSRFQDSSPKPLWLQMENDDDDDVVDDQDVMISTIKKSLEDLSPNHPFRILSTDTIKPDNLSVCQEQDSVECYKLCKNEKVVLYFTSLRGVRKTYEDCCDVRVILKGIGVRSDERDVSMHSGFKEELKELLGEELYKGGGLPRVFIGRRYLGGAEEIRRMHDEGKLEKAFEGCQMEENGVCDACGDVRFVPCETCSGSCKIYYEDEYQYDDEEDEDQDEDEEEERRDRGAGRGEGSDEGEFGFQRCPDCNENGLIRCPICCD